ncbi:hypothetical protein FRX31_025983, partial [Thalictrum thalictroides]
FLLQQNGWYRKILGEREHSDDGVSNLLAQINHKSVLTRDITATKTKGGIIEGIKTVQ